MFLCLFRLFSMSKQQKSITEFNDLAGFYFDLLLIGNSNCL